MREQIIREAKAINNELRRLQVKASIDPTRCTPGGTQLAFYGIRLHGSTRASEVTRILTEISRAVSQVRRSRTLVRFDEITLRFEVDHPAKAPLEWRLGYLQGLALWEAALGVSYAEGEQVVRCNLDDAPQILVAGETGSGKTVLLRNLITSMAYKTPPTQLRMVLLDPKREDLEPYRRLPHSYLFAGTRKEIKEAIGYAMEELEFRREHPRVRNYRVLIVADELAHLECLDELGQLMSIGRSKGLHVVGATQYPTEAGGIGKLMRGNIPLRLVGAVSAGQSYISTKRRDAQADMLPGKGSFLFIKGPTLYRFQSFDLGETLQEQVLSLIQQRWGKARYSADMAADIPPDMGHIRAPYQEKKLFLPAVSDTVKFPIGSGRPLTDAEAVEARRLAKSGGFHSRGEFSPTQLCIHVFGSRDPKRMQFLRQALGEDGTVIQLRKGSACDTTTMEIRSSSS